MNLVEKVRKAYGENITPKDLYNLSLEIFHHKDEESIFEELFKSADACHFACRFFIIFSFLGLFKESKGRKNKLFFITLKDMEISIENYSKLDIEEAYRRLLLVSSINDGYVCSIERNMERIDFKEIEGSYQHKRLLMSSVIYQEENSHNIYSFFGLDICLQNVANFIYDEFSQEMTCTQERVLLVKNEFCFAERKHLMFSNDLELSKKEAKIMLMRNKGNTHNEVQLFPLEAKILFSDDVLTSLILEGFVAIK